MKKTLFFLFSVLISLQSIGQEPDPRLLRQWYLTEVVVDGVSYIPSNYGYFPEVNYSESMGIYSIGLADPANILCTANIENFLSNPFTFTIFQAWTCFPTHTCLDGPTGPCTTIYGKHSEIYYSTANPIVYTIEELIDGTFTLEVENEFQNSARYSSVLLGLDEFESKSTLVYPNPVTNILFMASNGNSMKKATIFSITGQRILAIENPSISIDVSTLPRGVYFLEIDTAEGRSIQKFIKK